MAEPSLIKDYHAVLRIELPGLLADEVSDGLAEAFDKYQREGLDTDVAAQAAVAEFGDPRCVVTSFSRASPASRAARALVMTGPVVGLLWAAALITGRVWDWPVPVIIPVLFGSLLAASVVALVTAAAARRYRVVRRSGAAGCLGLGVLDISMITAVVAAAPGLRWPAVLAICASATRLAGIARACCWPTTLLVGCRRERCRRLARLVLCSVCN